MHSVEDGPDAFEDLRITGVDKGRTHNPDTSKKIYDVYLKLSERAPSAWSQLFDESHRSPRSSVWRRAHCDGEHIIIQCPVDEVQKHLDELKQDVATANREYRELSRKHQEQKKRNDDASAQERKRLDDTLDDLKFD